MNKVELYDLLLKTAHRGLSLLHPEKGYMPPGHNGPYHDPETPVRNSAHWLITFLKAYEISGHRDFQEAAHSNIRYLLSSDVRPSDATFFCRTSTLKDSCNGLIGQAWVIEALVEAYRVLENTEALELAEKIFLMHPFCEKLHLWKRIEVDGENLDYDTTFNHQLWFAAAGGNLSAFTDKVEIHRQVSLFMDSLSHLCSVYSTGLICHLLTPRILWSKMPRIAFRYAKRYVLNGKPLHYKSIGYHSFNLYAFSLLKNQFPCHMFWDSQRFRSALEYSMSSSYKTLIQDNLFGYPYNPPGFENAYALQRFTTQTRSQQISWIRAQLESCYNPLDGLMNLNTQDQATQSARFYEASRLSNLVLEF